MKSPLYHFAFLTALAFILTTGCKSPAPEFPEEAITSYDPFQKEFRNPSAQYGTVPFFVWNEDITQEGIAQRMQDYKDAGCGGVIVHPRPGLITEYLSEEWFELFRYTVEKGNELDLEVWIYDENSYPSGFAGGHVPALMPESFNQGQGLMPFDTTSIPADYEKYFLILKKENGAYRDITSTAGAELSQTGEYTLFTKTYYRKSGWFGGFSYVDLLYPGVTEKFLDITMEGYNRVSGPEYGKRVKGVFTDEPEINTPGGIRWTPDLFEVFEKQWGYDLLVNLPSLWKETGDWKKVRHNYTSTLLQLFIDRWAKPASEYFQNNGLRFTGHYWEHGWPSMRLGGDNMAMYAYHDVPGIDMLFNQFNEKSPNAQFGNVRSVKELASVANQFGRHRTLSETYGGAGWEITFEDLKRLGDWEYALGVNLMNQHLSYYSIAGARKYDYPPSFSYHNPWWKSYRYLNDYYARLSMALSSGIQENKILVIEPTTTAWLYDSYINSGRKPAYSNIGQSFQDFVTTLEKSQVEYDLGSEDIMRNHGKAGRTGLTVGKRTYTTVVIPPLTESLDRSTFDLIRDYAAGGGKIVAFSAPSLIDGAASDEISEFFSRKPENLVMVEELNGQIIEDHFANDNLRFEMEGSGNLFHHRRKMKDGQIIFLANASLEEESAGVITARGRDALLLDAFTGEITDYPDSVSGKDIHFRYRLESAGSLLLYISNQKIKGTGQPRELPQMAMVPPFTEMKITRDTFNVMPVDFVDLQIKGVSLKELHVGDASNKVYSTWGFPDGNPWNHSVQYKKSILEADLSDLEDGFRAVYRFTVSAGFDMSGIQAVVERPRIWTVYVNGQVVEPESGKWWLDQSFGVYPAGPWLKPGENAITLECSPAHIHAEIEPIYLTGNFTVQPAAKGWSVAAPADNLTTGSWKAQGHPFYSWDVTYSRDFNITSKKQAYSVSAGNWLGTVAEVFVNGEKAGTLALKTDNVDVTSLIREGSNTIAVKVTGSLKNLLGPHHNNPAPGLVSPWTWRNIKAYTPGSGYQLMDYGLMDDFRLTESVQ